MVGKKAETEEDAYLEELINKVKETKGHGKAMGQELDRQNKILTGIDGKAERANDKMTKINRILKKGL